MKYLIWLLIGLAVVVWFKRTMAKLSGNVQGSSGKSGSQVETMRQCAHCGTYIPASEALLGASGAIFCSEEHRVLHAPR